MKRLLKRRRPTHPVRRSEPVGTIDPDQVPATNRVLVAPQVIARFLACAARHPRNEVGALLLGRIHGRFLAIEDLVPVQNLGTAVNIEFTARDFDNAQEAATKDQCIVGWAHSHPGHTAFLSTTDVRFQSQGQDLFPDYVALVMDPFRARGVDYAFFRVEDEQPIQVPHHYLGGRHAA